MDVQAFFVQVEVFFESVRSFVLEQPWYALAVAVALLLALHGIRSINGSVAKARYRRRQNKEEKKARKKARQN